MPQKLSALAIGAKVKDVDTRYYGKPIVFMVADKNHAGYPANSVTLITEKIIMLKAFDAQEPNSSDSDRRLSGNNRYLHSNLRQWLNSDKEANVWFTAQHSTDAKPTTAACHGMNGYDTESGFLVGFSAKFRAALLPTSLTVVKNTVTDGGGSETVIDKVFLASTTEVGFANENGIAEGSFITLFNNTDFCIAYPTAESGASTSKPHNWRLRTPSATASGHARVVSEFYTMYNVSVNYGSYGQRPLCNLPSETWVSDTTNSDGTFTILWNLPPTEPDGITPSEMIKGGKEAVINWGESTDSDGTISGYILERAFDNGEFMQIHKGINRTFTDNITFGWNTVQYRVKAYDNEGEESGYTTSAVLDVINSNDPTIDGSDSDLGIKTGGFDITYTATNPDEHLTKTLTVVEKIDGKQKRSFEAVSGEENTFDFTAAEWLEVLNGAHTITITVTDNFEGTATRTVTFSKNETEIELTLETPLATDAAVTKAVMNITRQIPVGAEFTVEVCNNAYDEEPAWTDVTQAVVAGNKFFFANTEKTAEEWGFNVKVTVKRQSTEGDCYIQGMGGNFE